MKTLKIAIGALAAALVSTSGAHAEKLYAIYWGKDNSASVTIDGTAYSLADWDITVSNIYAGDHTLTLFANGVSRSFPVTLTESNKSGTDEWCIDLEDDTADVLDGDTCEDMYDYYWDGP